MNQKERRAARGLQIVAVCCCFCLLAVGAGVTYRAMDREKAGGGETLQKEQPVTAVQSKTIEIAQAEQQGEAEKTKEIKETKEAKETKAQPARKNGQPVFAAPLEGEMKVVLGYSTDHAIYDPTLEQYRTNASVSLSAKKGTEVKAAADGVVKDEIDDFGRHLLGCYDEVAFVFPVFVIDDDDDFSLTEILDGFFYCIQYFFVFHGLFYFLFLCAKRANIPEIFSLIFLNFTTYQSTSSSPESFVALYVR